MNESVNFKPIAVMAGVVLLVGAVAATSVYFAVPARVADAIRPGLGGGLEDGDGLRDRVLASYRRAGEIALPAQGENGAWQVQGFDSVSYTALYARPFARAPGELPDGFRRAGEHGLAYLASRQQADGSWAEPGGQHVTLATGLALSALSATDATRAQYADAVRKAQEWFRGAQQVNGLYRGAMGYAPRGQDSDKLPNLHLTAWSVESMIASGVPRDDPFVQMAAEFVQRCQNSSETNTDPHVVQALGEGWRVGNDGGFAYSPRPDLNKVAPRPNEDGTQSMGSYGAMTYAGLEAYLYAGLSKDDPRVRAAVGWIRGHFRVDGHPGWEYESAPRAERTGLYHYYMVMARTLDAWDETPLRLADGQEVDWPSAMAEQLLSLQHDDATWVNDADRWWEGDPVLVTGYVLNAYDALLGRLR